MKVLLASLYLYVGTCTMLAAFRICLGVKSKWSNLNTSPANQVLDCNQMS